MKISYNVMGADRKALVEAIKHELYAEAKYQGMPTMAYQIGDFTVDKTGMLTGPDDHSLVSNLRTLYDFTAVSEEFGLPVPEAEPAPEDLVIPVEAEFGGQDSPPNDYAEPPADDMPDREEDTPTDMLTIEISRDLLPGAAVANLRKIVTSKAVLIQKALGVDALPITEKDTQVLFPWIPQGASPEQVNATSRFIGALCTMATNLKRVTASLREVENEKYAFRCFLLRLGMIGAEYKAVRKVLMANLEGNSSYKVKADTPS